MNSIRMTIEATKSVLETKWTVRGHLAGTHFEVLVTPAELAKAGWLGVFTVATAALLREAGLEKADDKPVH